MSIEILQVSAKNLGGLALPDYCPRCFYLKLKLGFRLPWSLFPGIFSSIDSYSKKITWRYYEKYGKVPPWFTSLGSFVKPIPVPHYSKFCIVDDTTNIKLTGVMDDLFLMGDGSYFIIDYKTARYTKKADKLLPLYMIQLNGYAMIFEKLGMGKVGGLVLVYYEPQTEMDADRLDSLVVDGRFNMGFSAHLLKVDLDAEGVVVPLLKVVRELGGRQVAPVGRENCKDCGMMGRWG